MPSVQPSLAPASGSGKRRKRVAPDHGRAIKRGKTMPSRVQVISEALSTDEEDLNPIADLLAILAKPANEAERLESIHALHQAFVRLITAGRLHGKLKKDDDGAVKTVRLWLRARQTELMDALGSLLLASVAVSSEIRSTAMAVLFDLLKVENSLTGVFPIQLWSAMIGLFVPEKDQLDEEVRAELVSRWIDAHDDLRFYFLKALASSTAPSSNVLALMEAIEGMPSSADDLTTFWTERPIAKERGAAPRKSKSKKKAEPEVEKGIFDDSSDDEGESTAPKKAPKMRVPAVLSLDKHRKAHSEAWLALLPRLADEQQVKRALVVLHRLVLPHLPQPSVLLDFLTDCCDHGGTVALLALNGLFTLITRYNLCARSAGLADAHSDYPEFYKRLYGLLDRQVLHVRYRPRFFRMLDVFLSSAMLPTALVAAFVKRLSRLALGAPPAAVVTIVPFVYNLLKAHPTLMALIHRDAGDVQASDPFDMDEADPVKSHAMDSSLWELSSMRSHYLASVTTLGRIFAEPFKKPQYSLEDFYDHSYSTLFETEMARKLRNAPALDLPPAEAKTVEFFPMVVSEKPWSDAVTEMWTF